MINYCVGDLLADRAEALVNPVNTVGVMGKGLALAFKRAYPANYEAYVAAAKAGQLMPGRLFVFELAQATLPRYILNFPTKRHWRDRSRIEDIQAGLVDLVRVIRDREIQSLAIPALGCGLGGLNWADVAPLIVDALSTLPDVIADVYKPDAPTRR